MTLSGLLLERGQPHPNLPQVKQISCCQQTKYDRAIHLKAAAEKGEELFWQMKTQIAIEVSTDLAL